MSSAPVQITCYTDILCVWAYIAERRVVEIKEAFGDRVTLDYRCLPLFADTRTKFLEGWKDRGGFEGYADHVGEVVAQFDHVELNPDAWRKVRPASCLGPHLLLKAAHLCSPDGAYDLVERLAWRLRTAFFVEARDIALAGVRGEIIEELGLPGKTIQARLDDGTAFAALASDHEEQAARRIEGSPTLLLNNGRQKLYGNVGFRIIEANIQELLREPAAGEASWC